MKNQESAVFTKEETIRREAFSEPVMVPITCAPNQNFPKILLCRRPRKYSKPAKMCQLLRPHGEDFLALHFYFDANGRTEIRSLHDASAHPNAPRKICQLQRVKYRAAAGISDHGMFCGAKAVIGFQLFQIRDEFELTIAKRRFLRKGPVAI